MIFATFEALCKCEKNFDISIFGNSNPNPNQRLFTFLFKTLPNRDDIADDKSQKLFVRIAISTASIV